MKSRQKEIMERMAIENKPKVALELMRMWNLSGKVNEYYKDCPKVHIVHTIKSGIEIKYSIYNRNGKLIKREHI